MSPHLTSLQLWRTYVTTDIDSSSITSTSKTISFHRQRWNSVREHFPLLVWLFEMLSVSPWGMRQLLTLLNAVSTPTTYFKLMCLHRQLVNFSFFCPTGVTCSTDCYRPGHSWGISNQKTPQILNSANLFALYGRIPQSIFMKSVAFMHLQGLQKSFKFCAIRCITGGVISRNLQ